MKRRVAGTILIAVLLLGLAPAAYAQGCAMCRTEAEATGPEGGNALDLGILVLLIPTVAIFVGVVLWAFLFRNRGLGEEKQAGEPYLSLFPSGSNTEARVGLSKNLGLSRSRP